MEILITLIIGIAISIVSKILNSKFKDTDKNHIPEDYDTIRADEPVEVIHNNKTTYFNSTYDNDSNEDDEADSAPKIQNKIDSTNEDLISDFDPVKAIIYSEIIKPKYID